MPFKKGGPKPPNSGRKRGTPNKATCARRAEEEAVKVALKDGIEAARAFGMEPLDYMLSVMRDPNENSYMRMAAAKAALPYRHSRMPVKLQHPELDADGKPVGPTLVLELIDLTAEARQATPGPLAETESGRSQSHH